MVKNRVFRNSRTADLKFSEIFHPQPQTLIVICIPKNSGLSDKSSSRKNTFLRREKRPPTSNLPGIFFIPFLRRFDKNIGENGDGDKKSGRG